MKDLMIKIIYAFGFSIAYSTVIALLITALLAFVVWIFGLNYSRPNNYWAINAGIASWFVSWILSFAYYMSNIR
jgi:hypothetical protein